MGDESVGAYIGGVCLALVTTTLNATGVMLQKLTHKQRAAAAPKGVPAKPLWKEIKWMAGLACMGAGSLLSLAVFALLGQSRASAMAAVTIVTNAILSRLFLKEVFTMIDLVATLIIGSGTVVSVVFGSTASGPPIHDVETIVDLLHRKVVYIAFPIMVCAFFALLSFITVSSKRRDKRSHIEHKLECFARAFCAGLFSGTTGFLSKAVVTTITSMWKDKSAADLTRFEFYLFILSLPASLVCQVYFLNSGLKVFDAMEMIPPYQSSIVIVGVMFGWIYYNEGENVPTKNLILFAVGCGISIGGICVLLLKKRAKRAASELSQGTETEGRRASTADVMLAKLGEEVPLLSHPFGPSLSARSTSKETPLLPLHAGSDSTLAKPPVVAASAGESTLAPERSDSSDMLLDDRVADLEATPGQTVLTGDALERRMSTAGLAMVDAMVTAVHVVSSRLHSRSTPTDDAAHQRGSTERSDSHGAPSVAWQSYQNEHL